MENSNSKLVEKFYVKLYLLQKKEYRDQEKVISINDATRSWNSLCPEDKDIFIDQFQKRGSKRKAIIANYLKTASPNHWNRINSKSVLRNSLCVNIDVLSTTAKNIEDIAVPSESFEPNYFNSSEIPLSDSISGEEASVDPRHKACNSQPRPELPPALNAHQLFDLVNDKNSEHYQPWHTLTTTDKRRYQEALRKLKAEYLKKYELYLQDLTSEELYHHFIEMHNNTTV